MSESREWMRNYQAEGFVVGRFTGVYEQEERELIALQTVDGIVVVPVTAAIPVTSDYIVNQMALDLERVIRGMRAGGLTFDQLEHAWGQALSHIKQNDHGD